MAGEQEQAGLDPWAACCGRRAEAALSGGFPQGVRGRTMLEHRCFSAQARSKMALVKGYRGSSAKNTGEPSAKRIRARPSGWSASLQHLQPGARRERASGQEFRFWASRFRKVSPLPSGTSSSRWFIVLLPAGIRCGRPLRRCLETCSVELASVIRNCYYIQGR